MEYKDYRNFALGINDPPPAIKEHTDFLLNRITHALEAVAEKGFQIEAFISPVSGTRLIGNYTLARNEFSPQFATLFQERYLELELYAHPWAARFFIDAGQDDLFLEFDRLTLGTALERTLHAGPTIGAEVQWQRVHRGIPATFSEKFSNLYIALRLQGFRQFTLGVQLDGTTDADYTESVTYLPQVNLGWKPMPQLDIQLFLGKRRGGTACDHGYCIQVVDYEGAELRIETRF